MRKGAAFTKDDHLFVYQEMTPSDLAQTLPISYQTDKGHFFFVVFVNGCDYVGQMTEQKLDIALQEMTPFGDSPLKYQYQELVDSILGKPRHKLSELGRNLFWICLQ